MSVSRRLCEALDFPRPADVKAIDYDGRCGICGEHHPPFYRGQDLCSGSNAVFLEVFHGTDTPMCVYCTSLYKAQNPRTNNNGSKAMCVIGSMAGFPVIARDSAEKFNRPCWSDLVKKAKQGDPCVIILSTNTKKRVWPIAAEGYIGPSTPVTISDSDANMNATIYIDWDDMLSDLAVVEGYLARGMVKTHLFDTLLKWTKPPEGWTMEDVFAAEAAMKGIRAKPHAAFIRIIAQKP